MAFGRKSYTAASATAGHARCSWSGNIADATAAMATHGSSAMVDGNGTTVPSADADHAGGSAAAGADGASAIWGTAIKRTGSSDNTLRTVAGSSSGTSSLVLTGVVLG